MTPDQGGPCTPAYQSPRDRSWTMRSDRSLNVSQQRGRRPNGVAETLRHGGRAALVVARAIGLVSGTVGRPKATRSEENAERFQRRRQQEYELREAHSERDRAQREWNQNPSLANEAVLSAAIERLNRARERAEELRHTR